MIELNKIYCEDCLETLKRMPDNFIDCCVTSPPYYGLRDYGTAQWIGGDKNCNHQRNNKTGLNCNTGSKNVIGGVGDGIYKDICKKCGAVRIDKQIGLEVTPELYVQKLVEIFREIKRVLKPQGTLWLNLGDSYAGSGKASGQKPEHKNCGKIKQKRGYDVPKATPTKEIGLKPKDLIGIPWMVAFALRADGWWLRQDIIWNKPNPMPESVTDRCTKSHEYIFLLSKSQKYYYDADAIKTPAIDIEYKTPDGWDTGNGSHGNFHKEGREKGFKGYKHRGKGDKKLTGHSGNYDSQGNLIGNGLANKRSVWNVNTQPFKEAHFATFPEKLIVPCIKAGCPENGIVYDPFIGAGTTAIVAIKLNRNWIGSELSQKNVDLANNRIAPYKTQLKLQYD